MSRYKTAQLITMLRDRIGLQRVTLLRIMSGFSSIKLDETNLRRIEGEMQHPKTDTIALLLKFIDFPEEGFIYPSVEGQTMKAVIRCEQLEQALDRGDTVWAALVLAQLEAMSGFGSGIYHQFICSKRARLFEQTGRPTSEIIPIIEAGLAETFGNIDENDLVGKVLVLEEPELLHTRARLYAKDGDIGAAIKILSAMTANLAGLPMADREKEWQFTPVLLSLSGCLMQAGDYCGVLEACALGAEYSAAHKQGRHNPDFEFYKALALRGLGRTMECRPCLQRAYFSYMLLGEADKAQCVLEATAESFGVQFELYSVDRIGRVQQPAAPYSRGEPVDCNSIGTMITALRVKANLSRLQLCEGICRESTLKRIEGGKLDGHIYILEAIMQRLGRDINLFKNFFLSKEDFVSMQLRDQIEKLLIARRYAEASPLLRELESMQHFIKHDVNRQFVIMAKAMITASHHWPPHPEFPEILTSALKITYPAFGKDNIDRQPLTYNEIFIINALAGYFKDTNDAARAAEVYERLLWNLNEKYVDEAAKARMYSSIVLNYSSCLGKTGDRHEALAVVAEGMRVERSHRRLTMLPGLSYNTGFNMLKLGDGMGSLPHIAMAYYAASMFADYDRGMAEGASLASNLAKDELGVTFG